MQGRPVVDGVFVNGHGPYRFLVDTATTSNHIEPGLAQAIGLKATFRTELATAVGTVTAPGGNGVEVTLGEARADRQEFLFAGMEVVHQLSRDIQGILGQAFLSRFDYLLDLRGKRLEFGKQNPTGRRARLRNVDGRPAITTNLGDLVLDSGVARLILYGIEAAKGDMIYMKTVAGSQMAGLATRVLSIEGRSVWRGEAVTIPDRAEPGVAGLMPVNLFRSVYVSNSERYLVFE
ncbi:MAG: retropepsin-like aspartic protease [Bryobacteraceae bacterium]